MNEIWVHLNGEKTHYAPGDAVTGRCGWTMEEAPKSAEIRLFWFTAGIGTRDVGIIEAAPVEGPRAEDAHDFAFALPAEPFSFSGTLVSLTWAVEVLLEPGEETARAEFEMSPFADGIRLEKVETPKAGLYQRAGA